MGSHTFFLSWDSERHIRKTDITKSHCKIDQSCCQTSSQLTNTVIGTNVMRRQNRWQIT